MKWLSISILSMVLLFFLTLISYLVSAAGLNWSWDYLTSESEQMGRLGGIGPLLLSTFIVNGLAAFLVFVLGLPVALKISQKPSRSLNALLQILAGTPSIVFGLFGNVFFCRFLGLGYSLLAGSLTLMLMMLPFFISLCEPVLRETENEYRLISDSLALSEPARIFRVYIPTVFPHLVGAFIFTWARAAGETAALLFTSGYSMNWPESMMDSGRVLSVHIYDLAMNVSGADPMAFKAALVLLVLTFGISTFCHLALKARMQWKRT